MEEYDKRSIDGEIIPTPSKNKLLSLEEIDSLVALLLRLKKEYYGVDEKPNSLTTEKGLKPKIKIDFNSLMIENGLSRREVAVLSLLLEGLTNRQIADKLFISESTVKSHNQKIFEKLNVGNRTCLILKLYEKGYLGKNLTSLFCLLILMSGFLYFFSQKF